MIYNLICTQVEENEEVVNYALRKRNVKLVETGLEFGVEGFHRCYYMLISYVVQTFSKTCIPKPF